MITARGIYNNLKESSYSFTYLSIVFYFSSQCYKNKFKEGVENYINYQEKKLKSFYKLNLDFKKFLAISFYKSVEKRGFRIILDSDGKRVEKEDVLIKDLIT